MLKGIQRSENQDQRGKAHDTWEIMLVIVSETQDMGQHAAGEKARKKGKMEPAYKGFGV